MKSTKLVLCLCLLLAIYRELVTSADAGQDLDEKKGPLYYEDGEDYDKNEDDFDDEEDDEYYDESMDDNYHESVDKKYEEDENLSRVGNESTEAVNVKKDVGRDEDQYRSESTSYLGGNVGEENEDSDRYRESTSELIISERYNVKDVSSYDSKDEAKHVDGYDAVLRRLDVEENEDANRTDGSPKPNPDHPLENFVFQLRKNRVKSTNRTAYYGILIGPSTVVSASIKDYKGLRLRVCGDVCYKPKTVRKRGNFLVWKLPLKIKRRRVFFIGDITRAKCTRNHDTKTTKFVKISKNRFACDPKCGRHDAIVCDGRVAGLLTKGTRNRGYTFVKIATIIRSFVRRELGTKQKKMGDPVDLMEPTAPDKQREHSGTELDAGFAAKISSVLFGVLLFCSLIVSF